jgi:hypothetical protein
MGTLDRHGSRDFQFAPFVISREPRLLASQRSIHLKVSFAVG